MSDKTFFIFLYIVFTIIFIMQKNSGTNRIKEYFLNLLLKKKYLKIKL